jgi:hypothetical protein
LKSCLGIRHETRLAVTTFVDDCQTQFVSAHASPLLLALHRGAKWVLL